MISMVAHLFMEASRGIRTRLVVDAPSVSVFDWPSVNEKPQSTVFSVSYSAEGPIPKNDAYIGRHVMEEGSARGEECVWR
jgi:hypothetical protein